LVRNDDMIYRRFSCWVRFSQKPSLFWFERCCLLKISRVFPDALVASQIFCTLKIACFLIVISRVLYPILSKIIRQTALTLGCVPAKFCQKVKLSVTSCSDTTPQIYLSLLVSNSTNGKDAYIVQWCLARSEQKDMGSSSKLTFNSCLVSLLLIWRTTDTSFCSAEV